MDERQQRKLDHVRLAVAQERLQAAARPNLPAPGWGDVHLVHQSLPERNLAEVDLGTTLAGVPLARPIIINAMTGGAPGVGGLNRHFAEIAADLGLAMAVGSQTAGLRDPAVVSTYRVVREANPRGVILANVSTGATVEQAEQAVEMVSANLLQIHLNAPQELMMPEGDREFRGQLARIEEIVRRLSVPVVVKECGFGLSRESARQLYDVGVRAIDLSGRGGTNFAWIEGRRGGEEMDGGEDLDPGLEYWGIPTACALLEVAALELPGLEIVASGGISWGSEAARALALGARAVGVAGPVLRRLKHGGAEAAHGYMARLVRDMAAAALLAGASTLMELQSRPAVVTGETGAWCRLRGVDLERLASRR